MLGKVHANMRGCVSTHQSCGCCDAEVSKVWHAQPNPDVYLPLQEEKLELNEDILVWDLLSKADVLHAN